MGRAPFMNASLQELIKDILHKEPQPIPGQDFGHWVDWQGWLASAVTLEVKQKGRLLGPGGKGMGTGSSLVAVELTAAVQVVQSRGTLVCSGLRICSSCLAAVAAACCLQAPHPSLRTS